MPGPALAYEVIALRFFGPLQDLVVDDGESVRVVPSKQQTERRWAEIMVLGKVD